MNYRLKLLAFFLGALAILLALNVGYSALETFARLNAVEADRDRWQRPSDVIAALDLTPGQVVADVGCGSGYFSLKLSPFVGHDGRVIAEDIRRLPLVFLWTRAVSRGEHNVTIRVGKTTDPELPARINAVLISNTYHEFTDAHTIMVHVYGALVSGGRVVIVDREPKPAADTPALQYAEHEVSAEEVATELRRDNFKITDRQDHFIEHDPYGENWWLLVAKKP